jgi:apolipoprotein N-acyltransferase
LARAAVFQGVLLGFLVTLGGFFWVAYVLKQFGGLPWPAAILGLVLFAFIGQLQWVFFAPLARSVLLKSLHEGRWVLVLRLLWLAASYAAIEWLTPKLFRDTFGHHVVAFENLRMNARWAGAYGLTFLVVFVNLVVARVILGLRHRKEPSAWPVLGQCSGAIAVGVALFMAFWGYGRLTRIWVEKQVASATSEARIAVIQANIGDIEKLSARRGIREARRQVMSTFLQLSDEAVAQISPRPQALVWPETAYPSSFRKPRVADELELDQMVEAYARSRQIPLLFGGYDETVGYPRQDFNSFFFLGKEARAEDLQVYHKNRLLLFGETLPFSEVFPVLREWFPQVGNFGRGRGPEAFSLPTSPSVKAAPAICYEVLFPDDMAQAKRAGAELILNITNDSWFGPYAEPELHLALSTFRSIELGIPMLRATNTGISAVVDPAGRILSRTKIGVPAVLDGRIPLVALPASLVEKWGDFLPKLFVFLSLVGGAVNSLATLRFRLRD